MCGKSLTQNALFIWAPGVYPAGLRWVPQKQVLKGGGRKEYTATTLALIANFIVNWSHSFIKGPCTYHIMPKLPFFTPSPYLIRPNKICTMFPLSKDMCMTSKWSLLRLNGYRGLLLTKTVLQEGQPCRYAPSAFPPVKYARISFTGFYMHDENTVDSDVKPFFFCNAQTIYPGIFMDCCVLQLFITFWYIKATINIIPLWIIENNCHLFAAAGKENWDKLVKAFRSLWNIQYVMGFDWELFFNFKIDPLSCW